MQHHIAVTEMPVEVRNFTFTGRVKELLPIVLRNLLFTILTLGLYRFWAKTRVRQYIWSHTFFMDDPFEYTGTGKELFLGFVMVSVFMAMPASFLLGAALYLPQDQQAWGLMIFLVVTFAYLFLLGAAKYRRYRYALSRSRWRGVRGAQTEKGFRFGALSMVNMALNSATLGLTYPSTANASWAHIISTRRFGSGNFGYWAPSKPLYWVFFLVVGGAILCFAAISELPGIKRVVHILDQAQFDITMDQALSILPDMLIALAIISFVLVPLILWYRLAQLRHFIGNIKFDTAMMAFTATYKDILAAGMASYGVFVLTCGLGRPVAQLIWARFLMSHLQMNGTLDVETILQSEGTPPKYGEGLVESMGLEGI